jgi:hypothetical protein
VGGKTSRNLISSPFLVLCNFFYSTLNMTTATTTSSVLASFQYIKNLEVYEREKPYMIADIEYIPESKRSNIELEWRQVPIRE